MEKLRKELNIDEKKSKSFGLYGLNDIDGFVDNELSKKWVKEDNTSNWRSPNKTSIGTFKDNLNIAYKVVAEGLGFNETSSQLVKLLTNIKEPLNEFVHGSDNIYNPKDTKDTVLGKLNNSEDVAVFKKIINAMNRQSNFYKK